MKPILLNSPTSFFGNTESRLKKHTLLFRFTAEIALVVGGWYLHWRIFHTLNWNALWLTIPLLFAEIYSYFSGLLFVIGLWRPIERTTQSIDLLIPSFHPEKYPRVDVFITCYNEPIDIIETTTRAALQLDYPIDKLRIYVLDDGNSPAVKSLVNSINHDDQRTRPIQHWYHQLTDQLNNIKIELNQLLSLESESETLSQNTHFNQFISREKKRLGTQITQAEQHLKAPQRCHYIARPKPSDRPHHAKAGNINYALFCGKTEGEFIVTLDADHILKPSFLQRTLPYFFTFNLELGRYLNNRVAFVQTPQDFYNLPADDPFGHAAHIFYGPVQQGKDGLNSAFYTGTNAILRREALMSVGIKKFAHKLSQNQDHLDEFELIGALATNSITEDMNTAMHLHANGWQSVYHNELLAEGLAPDDLGSTLKQRSRWAQGTIQVLLRDNPLTLKGLNLWQRLQYFQTMYSYFSGFATLIYLMGPIVYFFTGTSAVQTDGISVIIHFLPMFIFNRLMFMIAVWGINWREIWRAEQYAIALFPVFIKSVLSVVTGQSLAFQVTPKKRQSGIYLKLILPQLFIFGLTLSGMGWSLLEFGRGHLSDPWIYAINGLWASYNLCLLWSIIRAAFWEPKSDKSRQSNQATQSQRSLMRL